MLGQFAEIPFTQLDSHRTGIDAGCIDDNNLVFLDDTQQFLGNTLDVVGRHIGVISDTPCPPISTSVPVCSTGSDSAKVIFVVSLSFFNYTTAPTCKTKKGPLSENTESGLGSNPWSKEMNLFFRHANAVLIGHASHFGHEIAVFFGRF